MNRTARLALPIVLTLLWLLPRPGEAQTYTEEGAPPEGFGAYESTQDTFPCIPPDEYDHLEALSSPRPRALAPGVAAVVDSLYDWPLQNALHDGVILVNYVDNDPSVGGLRDYMGYGHTYDGHRGTDMTLLNFRAMDRGVPVLAAADGLVISIADGFFDRQTSTGPFNANYVLIDHGIGNRAWYFHLRRNSITVQPGEFVRRGQMIGFAGSSGSSTDAHLHFEPALRDPWSGPSNPVPSKWRNQDPYVGTLPARVYDMGVFTNGSIGGSFTLIPPRLLKERLSQPVVFGRNEPRLGFWLQLQGPYGDYYRLEIRRPDQSLFTSVVVGFTSKIQYGWNYFYWALPGGLPTGTWTATVITGAGAITTLPFTVGDATVFQPRLQPAGRSLRLGSPQPIQDVLQASSQTQVTYSLRHAPALVSLQEANAGGSVYATVTVNQPTEHRHRSQYFQVLATDGSGRQDTMWYHLVDPAAPNRREVPARVFVRDGHRTTPNAPAASSLCLQVEPVEGSFDGSDVDVSRAVMTSWDTGSKNEIGSDSPKQVVLADTDRNGIMEVPICFSRNDLAELFAGVKGRQTVTVEVDGDVATGDRFHGSVELTVVGTGNTSESLEASVFPNPLNPVGYVRFSSPRSERVTVRIFDLGGRLVRTLMDAVPVSAGTHSIRIDGADGRGGHLASGVYFYRVESAGGVAAGRFVVLK
jgi:murein DD-endopeptidase MepM/ murein hydrolase activator NlpD